MVVEDGIASSVGDGEIDSAGVWQAKQLHVIDSVIFSDGSLDVRVADCGNECGGVGNGRLRDFFRDI